MKHYILHQHGVHKVHVNGTEQQELLRLPTVFLHQNPTDLIFWTPADLHQAADGHTGRISVMFLYTESFIPLTAAYNIAYTCRA